MLIKVTESANATNANARLTIQIGYFLEPFAKNTREKSNPAKSWHPVSNALPSKPDRKWTKSAIAPDAQHLYMPRSLHKNWPMRSKVATNAWPPMQTDANSDTLLI